MGKHQTEMKRPEKNVILKHKGTDKGIGRKKKIRNDRLGARLNAIEGFGTKIATNENPIQARKPNQTWCEKHGIQRLQGLKVSWNDKNLEKGKK